LIDDSISLTYITKMLLRGKKKHCTDSKLISFQAITLEQKQLVYWNAGVTGHINHEVSAGQVRSWASRIKRDGWGGESHAAFLPH